MFTHTIRRRLVIGSAALTATALALAGCGRSADTPSGGAAGDDHSQRRTRHRRDLTVWAMGTEGENLPKLIKEFEQANPGVKVTVTPIPWDAAHNKFTTAITAQTTARRRDGRHHLDGRVRRPRRARPDPGRASTTSGFFPGAHETTKVGGTQLRRPLVRRDAAGVLPQGPGREGRHHHAADRLGRPEGDGQGDEGQGRREVRDQPAAGRHGLLADGDAVRLVRRRDHHR